MIHVLMPFSRNENYNFYKEKLKDKNIIWHPVYHTDFYIPNINENWISPYLITEIPEEDPNICKLNFFIDIHIFKDEDYYCFINDDDWVADNFFEEINKCNNDIIFCTMKRGHNIPKGATPHGINTLYPMKGVGCGFIGIEQIIVKGKILKDYKFIYNHMFDGIFAEYLQENYTDINYNQNIIAFFNYLEKGRWIKQEEVINMVSLQERFERLKKEGRDISQHLDTLYDYALGCNTVIEMGVNEGVSTTAFLLANPKNFYCYDYIQQQTPLFKELENICINEKINFNFILADTRKIEIVECDLLFIDTLHIYDQLIEELNLHGNKAKKYIILHDTETFKYYGITPNSKGLWQAIEEFLESNKHWKLKNHFTYCNGLTILERGE